MTGCCPETVTGGWRKLLGFLLAIQMVFCQRLLSIIERLTDNGRIWLPVDGCIDSQRAIYWIIMMASTNLFAT